MWRLFLNKARSSGWLWLILGAGLLASLVKAASPVILELRIADLEREGVRAEGVQVLLKHFGDRQDVTLRVDSLAMPGLERPLTGVEFSCPDSRRPWPALRCKAGNLKLADGPWGTQELGVELEWDAASGLQLVFSGLRYAGGRLRGRFEWTGDTWKLTTRAPNLVLARSRELRALRKEWGLSSLSGKLAGRFELKGDSEGIQHLSLRAALKGLDYADKAGEQAAEKLAGSVRISGAHKGDGWSGSADIELKKGEVYSDPVFIDIGQQALHLTGKGRWQGRSLRLDRLTLDGGDMLQVKGNGRLDIEKQAIRNGQLRVDSGDLGSLYRQVLQPLLVGTRLDDLEVAGDAGFGLQWKNSQLVAVDAAVNRLDFDHRAGSFGANGLAAQLFWRGEGSSPDSQIRIEGGHLGKINFGETLARFNAAGQYAWLLDPVSIPFYGGAVEVSQLSWVEAEQGADVGFSVEVGNVSLEALSGDLGWPRMQGRIASEIPRARYRKGSLVVDGDLVIDAFDGRLVMRKLRLDELDSAAPVLQADMELRRLDLSQLTQTFSFGEIQGRLDGEVKGLQLVAWQPNHFDARFYSSPKDDSRHRISQRAVENLTELGNGVSGALSASFLRFFEEFSYDRIELQVRQQGNKAWIDGIPAADGGYYLVKGSGIPRIDVIGRNREVAWNDLLARLKSIRVEGVQLK